MRVINREARIALAYVALFTVAVVLHLVGFVVDSSRGAGVTFKEYVRRWVELKRWTDREVVTIRKKVCHRLK